MLLWIRRLSDLLEIIEIIDFGQLQQSDEQLSFSSNVSKLLVLKRLRRTLGKVRRSEMLGNIGNLEVVLRCKYTICLCYLPLLVLLSFLYSVV